MRCKEGINTNRLRPELLQLFPIVDAVFFAFNRLAVITSTNDGYHMKGSLHYQDLAFDLRVKHLGDFPARHSLFTCLKREIDRVYPAWFDVLHEAQHTDAEHIHIEASPLLCGLIEGSTREVTA